jgi:hypothetical protein
MAGASSPTIRDRPGGEQVSSGRDGVAASACSRKGPDRNKLKKNVQCPTRNVQIRKKSAGETGLNRNSPALALMLAYFACKSGLNRMSQNAGRTSASGSESGSQSEFGGVRPSRDFPALNLIPILFTCASGLKPGRTEISKFVFRIWTGLNRSTGIS